MTQVWNYRYEDNEICVTNTTFGSELVINGQLQDKKNGISLQDNLEGKLPDGKIVKVSLGGFREVECTLFVDNVLQKPVEEK